MITLMAIFLGIQGAIFFLHVALSTRARRLYVNELRFQRDLRLRWYEMALDTAIKLDLEQRRRGRGSRPEAWS